MISEQHWELLVRAPGPYHLPFCKKVLLDKRKTVLQAVYGIPFDVYDEMVRGAGHFEEIEVWGKREVYKDPIAVGITGDGERHLICRPQRIDTISPSGRIPWFSDGVFGVEDQGTLSAARTSSEIKCRSVQASAHEWSVGEVWAAQARAPGVDGRLRDALLSGWLETRSDVPASSLWG